MNELRLTFTCLYFLKQILAKIEHSVYKVLILYRICCSRMFPEIRANMVITGEKAVDSLRALDDATETSFNQLPSSQ